MTGDVMRINMTKSKYQEKYGFEGKISSGILEKHEFLPELVVENNEIPEDFWSVLDVGSQWI
jgi:hypothetical protein